MIDTLAKALLGFLVQYLERKYTESQASKAEAYKKLLEAWKEVSLVEAALGKISATSLSNEEFDAIWNAAHDPTKEFYPTSFRRPASERVLIVRKNGNGIDTVADNSSGTASGDGDGI